MSQQPPEILAAQQKLLEAAQRKTVRKCPNLFLNLKFQNEEIQRKLELLGKQVAAAQAQQQAQALIKQAQRKQEEELRAQQLQMLQKVKKALA